MKNQTKKVVFFDLDGTISDIKDGVRPATVDAIRQLQINGHYPFVCTGRSRCFIDPAVLKMDFLGMVASMGAYLEYQRRCIFNKEVTTTEAKFSMEALRENGLIPVMEGREYMYYDEEEYTEDVDWFAGLITEQLGPRHLRIQGNENVMHINKISAKKTAGCNWQQACKELEPYFTPVIHEGGMAGITLEFGPKNISKGSGMKMLLDRVGLGDLEIISFGDSNNDLAMFEVSDYTVAMGNANETLKRQADYVTANQNEEGITKGLQHLGLI